MSDHNQAEEVIPNGEKIVERFGGIRPMASKLNVPVTTVQGWKKRDAIPAIRRDEILNAAAHYDIDLKGVLSDSVANQNDQGRKPSTIAEDPALTFRPASPAPQAARLDIKSQSFDMRDVKRIARRTSLLTSAALIVLVAGVGFVFFGGKGSPLTPSDNAALESRVTAVEQQQSNFSSLINQSTAALQQQIANLTNAFGFTPQQLADVARSVTAGGGATITQRLAVLEKQLNANQTAGVPPSNAFVDNLQSMAQNPAQWQAAVDELRNVVNSLQGRMDNFDTALQQAKTENQTLAQTFENISGRDLSAAAMLLALTQLRAAADRQTPFTEDLALLRNVAQGSDPQLAASIDKMAPYAETGILSPGGLKRELQASANDIISAKLKGENLSLKDRVMARLQGLFSIKKDGMSVAGGTERALIDQASRQLDNNDVAGAMATLQQLRGPAAQAAQPWQQKASATLSAQVLDNQLVNAILAKLKNAGSPRVINLVPMQQPQPQITAPQPMPEQPQLSAPETPIQQ